MIICQSWIRGNFLFAVKKPFDVFERIRRTGRSHAILLLDFLEDFGSMNGDISGGADAQFDLVSFDIDDENFYILANHDGLIYFTRKNQQFICPENPAVKPAPDDFDHSK